MHPSEPPLVNLVSIIAELRKKRKFINNHLKKIVKFAICRKYCFSERIKRREKMVENEKPVIDADSCTGCTICIDECPTSALEMQDDISVLARPENCTGCGACENICPVSAIAME